MKSLISLLFICLLNCEDAKTLTIIMGKETWEISDRESISAIMDMMKSKRRFIDDGPPDIIGIVDTKIAIQKTIICEVNPGLAYYTKGKIKYAIPEKLLPIITIAINGPVDPWHITWRELVNDRYKEREINARDPTIQKKLSQFLQPYFGQNQKPIDDYPFGDNPRYLFWKLKGESIEYDIKGQFVFNGVKIVKLTNEENIKMMAFVKSLDPKFPPPE